MPGHVGYTIRNAAYDLRKLPLRAGQRWAWRACWAVLIAYLGYTLIFGVHESTILTCSLIGVITLPVLLLAQIPALARRRAS